VPISAFHFVFYEVKRLFLWPAVRVFLGSFYSVLEWSTPF